MAQTRLSWPEQTKFDLIVLDIMLPNLDGLSFCRILRKEQATPIIMLTARGGEVDRIVGLEVARTIISSSPSAWASFWRACERCFAARRPLQSAPMSSSPAIYRLTCRLDVSP